MGKINEAISCEELESYSIEKLEELSNSGDYRASHIIGRRYYEGVDVAVDYEKSVYYYEIGQENNYYKSLNNLGNMFNNGDYFPKNTAKAITLYSKAINNGSVNAILNLVYILLYNEEFKDLEKAIELLKQGEDLGDERSIILFGDCYMVGLGVIKDYFKAIEKYESVSNNAIALNKLGNIFYNEEGMAQDLEKAFNYYKKSAQLGYVHGQKNLAECYELGEGTKININKAIQYYELASKQDCNYSYNRLIELKQSMEGK